MFISGKGYQRFVWVEVQEIYEGGNQTGVVGGVMTCYMGRVLHEWCGGGVREVGKYRGTVGLIAYVQ